jgi:hypothetical protein
MSSSVMLHRVAIVSSDISEERSSSILRVTIIGELGKLTVTSNRRTLDADAILLSEEGLHIKEAYTDFCNQH